MKSIFTVLLFSILTISINTVNAQSIFLIKYLNSNFKALDPAVKLVLTTSYKKPESVIQFITGVRVLKESGATDKVIHRYMTNTPQLLLVMGRLQLDFNKKDNFIKKKKKKSNLTAKQWLTKKGLKHPAHFYRIYKQQIDKLSVKDLEIHFNHLVRIGFPYPIRFMHKSIQLLTIDASRMEKVIDTLVDQGLDRKKLIKYLKEEPLLLLKKPEFYLENFNWLKEIGFKNPAELVSRNMDILKNTLGVSGLRVKYQIYTDFGVNDFVYFIEKIPQALSYKKSFIEIAETELIIYWEIDRKEIISNPEVYISKVFTRDDDSTVRPSQNPKKYRLWLNRLGLDVKELNLSEKRDILLGKPYSVFIKELSIKFPELTIEEIKNVDKISISEIKELQDQVIFNLIGYKSTPSKCSRFFL